MKRIEAIKIIMDNLEENEIVIASNGMISREVYQVKDRPLNFYVLGSMGMALAIGIGIAYNSNLKVSVISGDGAALMSMGTMALHHYLYMEKGMKNLTHYILDNKCHATTGGQKTCSSWVFWQYWIGTEYFKVDCDKGDAPRIPLTCEQIKERFINAIDLLYKK